MSTSAVRHAGIGLPAIAIAGLTTAALAVQQPPVPHANALPGAIPADTFQVTMTVTLQLSDLHPAATTGGLLCGSKAGSQSDLSSLRNSIQSAPRRTDTDAYYQTFASLILSPAHFNNAELQVSFPITNRGYSGTQTVTRNVPNSELVDPQSRAVWSSPAVLVGCWLTLNGTHALYGVAKELATPNNVDRIIATSTVFAVQLVSVTTQERGVQDALRRCEPQGALSDW